LLETHWEPTKFQKTPTPSHHPQKKNKIGGVLGGVCWFTSLVCQECKMPTSLCFYHLICPRLIMVGAQKGLFKTLIECPYLYTRSKMVTNKCKGTQISAHTRRQCIQEAFLLGGREDGFFSFFLLFPRNSHQVPHVPNVFSNMFHC
jgi:hypothetical protein